VSSPLAAPSQFGAASQPVAYRANDPATELWAMPPANAAASAAISVFAAFGGTARHPALSRCEPAACQATRARPQRPSPSTMQATPSLSVTATDSSGTLTLTGVNKGTLSNPVPISLGHYGARDGEAKRPGLTCTSRRCPALLAILSGLAPALAAPQAAPARAAMNASAAVSNVPFRSAKGRTIRRVGVRVA
jgi:phage tail sheath gpL-like